MSSTSISGSTATRVDQGISPRTTLWRYLDTAKLIDLLRTQELHLSCVTGLDDPWEGRLPSQTSSLMDSILETLPDAFRASRGGTAAARRTFAEAAAGLTWDSLNEELRAKTFINCWHRSPRESILMWQVYAERGSGVAIRTTVDRLRRAVKSSPDVAWIKRVRYLNQAKDEVSIEEPLSWAAWKRHGYNDEREIRLGVLLREDDAPYLRLPVDVRTLAQSIVISPLAPEYVAEAVRTVVELLAPGLRVQDSSLATTQ